MDLTVGILSGGKSSRMGCDKAFLTIEKQTFLDRLIDEMSCYNEVLIAVDSIEKYHDYQSICVVDENHRIGPIEGIRQILKKAAFNNVFIGAVDMPYLNKQVIEVLKPYLTEEYDCCILKGPDGIHPLCGIYTKEMLPLIEDAIIDGRYKLRLLLERCRTNYVSLDLISLSQKVLKNINNKQDYDDLMKDSQLN